MLRESWEKFLAWYENVSDLHPYWSAAALVVIVTIFAVLIPIFLLAEFNDVYEASDDLRTIMSKNGGWKYFLLFLVWLSVAVYLIINMRHHLFLFFSTLRLSNWCARRGCPEIAKSIVKKNRPITWSWTKYLERSTTDQRPQLQTSSVAYDALVSSYLDGVGRIREGLPLNGSTNHTDPLLPSNFLLYARCVEQIRDAIANKYKNSRKVRVAIRTLLTRDITWWYNIQRIHLPDDRAVRCTTDWWEDYRDGIRNENLKNKSISLHRLLRFHPPQNNDEPEIQKSYFKLSFKEGIDRRSLKADEFVKVKEELDTTDWKDAIEWLGNAKWLGKAQLLVDLPNIHLHPICLIKDQTKVEMIKQWSSSSGPFVFISAFEDYKYKYHETEASSYEEPKQHGAWCKQISKDLIDPVRQWISRYDDLFLVDFYRNEVNGELLGRFGISFRIEEEKDIAGIRLLSSEDVDNAVAQFDEVWEEASDL